MDETGPADVPSAFQSLYTCFRIFIVSGRPPRNFESQRRRRSGSMCRWMRPLMVGPKVFSWSEPVRAIQRQHSFPLRAKERATLPRPHPRRRRSRRAGAGGASNGARTTEGARTDPDQIPAWVGRGRAGVSVLQFAQPDVRKHAPVGGLDARRERRANAGAGANTDAALVKGGRVGHAGELVTQTRPAPSQTSAEGARGKGMCDAPSAHGSTGYVGGR